MPPRGQTYIFPARKPEFSMRLLSAAVSLLFAATMAAAQESGNAEEGFAYASVHCSECHAIEAGVYGMSIFGAPSFEEIANVRGMSELAIVSFFQTSHPSMPNFVVATPDARNLIAYLQSLKD
jgi:mono/diheme cytochrome c family protein